jgi:hypothetical protein
MDGIFSIFSLFAWFLEIIVGVVILGLCYLVYAYIKVGRDIDKREKEKRDSRLN